MNRRLFALPFMDDEDQKFCRINSSFFWHCACHNQMRKQMARKHNLSGDKLGIRANCKDLFEENNDTNFEVETIQESGRQNIKKSK